MNNIAIYVYIFKNVAEPKVRSVIISTSTYVIFNFSTKLPIPPINLHTYSI